MTCHEFTQQLDAYLAGTLGEADATALEQHAATCAECEALLASATAIPLTLTDFAVPPEIRKNTMAAIALGGARRRTVFRWRAVAAVAASILIVVVVRNQVSEPRITTVGSEQPGTVQPINVTDRLASERSSTEFTALDAAARELEAALKATPNDEELRAFLATVQARRDELTRRVKAARS